MPQPPRSEQATCPFSLPQAARFGTPTSSILYLPLPPVLPIPCRGGARERTGEWPCAVCCMHTSAVTQRIGRAESSLPIGAQNLPFPRPLARERHPAIMSFRGVWVLDAGAADRIVFSRRFPAVEKRAKRAAADSPGGLGGAAAGSLAPIPGDAEWAEAVLAAWDGRLANGNQTPCNDPSLPPVYRVDESHWPVVVIGFGPLRFVCAPMRTVWDDSYDILREWVWPWRKAPCVGLAAVCTPPWPGCGLARPSAYVPPPSN